MGVNIIRLVPLDGGFDEFQFAAAEDAAAGLAGPVAPDATAHNRRLGFAIVEQTAPAPFGEVAFQHTVVGEQRALVGNAAAVRGGRVWS